MNIANAHHKPDAVYYQQMVPRLIKSLRKQRLLLDLIEAGQFLLARCGDRLIWIQVLETGYNYVRMQIKGLELQETSCHTIEAYTIDNIIESSIRWDLEPLCHSYWNKNWFYSLSMVMDINVNAYVDVKLTLTGLIDSPETYDKIQNTFGQALLWILVRNRIKMSIMNGIKPVKQSQTEPILLTSAYDTLQPMEGWSKSCYDYSRSYPLPLKPAPLFQPEWLEHAIRQNHRREYTLTSAQLDSLQASYHHIVSVCHSILFGVVNVSRAETIYQLFNGIIFDYNGRKFLNQNKELLKACIQATQYSTKIVFDQFMYVLDESLSNEPLSTMLMNLDQNWYFGDHQSDEWKSMVIKEKTNLFSINKDVNSVRLCLDLLRIQIRLL